uniref:uncharacterized protein si:ch211-151h10.2 isoform X2 n=1 Tax=Scatophagus argus TaxID=75038 RepID=UPI001ED7E8F3|nr:uncharacterized protein si:ch211-151h10.2 isoform X2 [Scatophagus argus]
MEEDAEGEPVQRGKPQSSNQTPAVRQSQQTSRSQTLRRTLQPLQGWCSFALAGVVWSVCQVEVPLHRVQVDVCRRLLLVCLLWTVLAGCVYALKCCLRPGRDQGEPPLRIQQEAVTENKRNQYSWTSPSGSHDVPLALVLADSLLLCVLQEPLPDPSVPHIKALISRLESVSHTLDVGSEATPEEPDRDSVLKDKVKLIRDYLQERMRSLRRLVQVQGDFEASVKDMLQGLHGLWAHLEELHMGVTLTKEGSHKDLVSAQSDAKVLFAVLGHYRSRLECSQAHLKDSTQLLQELTWSHAHISNSASSSSESVWPELLLQSNIEQFDMVQESFLSLTQQTSTFQAHLQGLEKGHQNGHAGPLAHPDGTQSCPVSPRTSLRLHNRRTSEASPEHRHSTSVSTSVSSADVDADADPETDARLTLCERSALQFSSTIGRLRKSGRRK